MLLLIPILQSAYGQEPTTEDALRPAIACKVILEDIIDNPTTQFSSLVYLPIVKDCDERIPERIEFCNTQVPVYPILCDDWILEHYYEYNRIRSTVELPF